MNIERDMADLWFSLSESEKDATKHETKAGMEISQCKTTKRPYLAQIASDLFGPKNKKCLKSKVGIKKVPSVFSFSASEPRYSHFVTQNEDFRKNKVIPQSLKTFPMILHHNYI